MATTETPKPATRPRWYSSILFPLTVVLIAVAVVLGLRYAGLPRENLPLGLISVSFSMLSGLILAVWLVLLSGWRWYARWGVLIAAALLIADSADWANMHFDGDVHAALIPWRVPILHRLFGQTPDDVLEADRKNRKPAEKAAIPGGKETDYPAYRGQNRDGIVVGPALNRGWSTPPQPLWKYPIGGGYAGFAVVGDQLVTIEQRRDREAVVAYDANTGQERWVHSWQARFSERMGGDGPRATPTIYDGLVYALGAKGKLVCLDAGSGEIRWEHNIFVDSQNVRLPWAMSGSPLVFDDVVVVNPGAQDAGPGKALSAYDRKTGELKWENGDTQAGYSSPMLAMLGGMEQILLLDGDRLAGYDPKSGNLLWSFPWANTTQKINAAQPVVAGEDRIFISSGYGVGGAMVKVTKKEGQWSAQELWKTKDLKAKFSSPVVNDGFLYGLDEGVLVCLDAATGKKKWRGERYGHGQLVLNGDLLVIVSEVGNLALVEARPDEFKEIGIFRALDEENKNWNPFALVNGKVYMRNHEQMAAYDLAGEKGK